MVHIGRWVDVDARSGDAVLAQVNEFVQSFHVLSGSMPLEDQVVITEKRITGMLRSAKLRLEVITSFVDANINVSGRNMEKLQAAARELVVLLAQEGIGKTQEISAGPETDGSAMLMRHSSVNFGQRPSAAANNTVSFYEDPEANKEGAVAESQQQNTRMGEEEAEQHDADRPSGAEDSVYMQQMRQREDTLRYKLQCSTEREQDTGKRLRAMEMENLRLERALLEVSESRERMKGLVEEQVYTQALHTRIMGLLHLEKNRNFDSPLTRGILFWCCTLLVLVFFVPTSLQVLFDAYTDVRTTISFALPHLCCHVFDLCVAAFCMAAAHEWATYAIHDLCYGSIHFLLDTLLRAAEEPNLDYTQDWGPGSLPTGKQSAVPESGLPPDTPESSHLETTARSYAG